MKTVSLEFFPDSPCYLALYFRLYELAYTSMVNCYFLGTPWCQLLCIWDFLPLIEYGYVFYFYAKPGKTVELWNNPLTGIVMGLVESSIGYTTLCLIPMILLLFLLGHGRYKGHLLPKDDRRASLLCMLQCGFHQEKLAIDAFLEFSRLILSFLYWLASI